MLARFALLALAVIAAACTSAQQQYVARRPNLSCDDANRYAFSSVRSLGYTVGRFQLAQRGTPGLIKASKPGERGGEEHATVDIKCDATGVEVFGAKDESLLKQDVTFSRGFFLAFTGLVDHGAEMVAWHEQETGGTTGGGVKFKIQPQIGLETKLDFGENLVFGLKEVRIFALDEWSLMLRQAGFSDARVTAGPLWQPFANAEVFVEATA